MSEGKYNAELECRALAARMKKICEKKGLSYYAVARQAGVSVSSIYNLMNGRTVPTVYTLYKLCNAMDTNIENLLLDKIQGLSTKEYGIIKKYREFSRGKINLMDIFIEVLEKYEAER